MDHEALFVNHGEKSRLEIDWDLFLVFVVALAHYCRHQVNLLRDSFSNDLILGVIEAYYYSTYLVLECFFRLLQWLSFGLQVSSYPHLSRAPVLPSFYPLAFLSILFQSLHRSHHQLMPIFFTFWRWFLVNSHHLSTFRCWQDLDLKQLCYYYL